MKENHHLVKAHLVKSLPFLRYINNINHFIEPTNTYSIDVRLCNCTSVVTIDAIVIVRK